jgi:arylsulfatase A-like enzyme
MWLHRDKPLTVKQGLVPLPPYFPDTETVRNDVARNYSNIELLDKMVGNLIKELKADGLFDKTYIFFLVTMEALCQEERGLTTSLD